MDSTVRIWDLSSELYGIDRSLKSNYLIKFKNKKGKKLKVTTCRYSADGRLVAGAAEDGSI